MLRIIGFLVIVLLAGGAYLSTKFVYDAYLAAPDPSTAEVTFTVSPGESVSQIVERLEAQGMVSGGFPFKVFLKFTDADTTFQAGTFTLRAGMSFTQLAAALSRALAQEVEVTIPEGYTAAQIGAAVRQALPNISEASWAAAVGPDSPIWETELWEETDGTSFEGFLFPDTYRFRADADARTVVETMLTNFWKRFGQGGLFEAGVPAGVEHVYGAIILASIVEREVREHDEMRAVAGIFLKRLRDGMLLQADSTVNYATGGDRPSATFEDLQVDSPYNTYKYAGLPPGPISNPGLAALQAVFNPEENDYYYFLTDPEGKVYYGRTYAEHLSNRRYLR